MDMTNDELKAIAKLITKDDASMEKLGKIFLSVIRDKIAEGISTEMECKNIKAMIVSAIDDIRRADLSSEIEKQIKEESVKLNTMVQMIGNGFQRIKYRAYEYENYKDEVIEKGEPFVVEYNGNIIMVIGNGKKSVKELV